MMAVQQRRGVQNPFRKSSRLTYGGPRNSASLPTHLGSGGFRSAHGYQHSPFARLRNILCFLVFGGVALYTFLGSNDGNESSATSRLSSLAGAVHHHKASLADIEVPAAHKGSESSHSNSVRAGGRERMGLRNSLGGGGGGGESNDQQEEQQYDAKLVHADSKDNNNKNNNRNRLDKKQRDDDDRRGVPDHHPSRGSKNGPLSGDGHHSHSEKQKGIVSKGGTSKEEEEPELPPLPEIVDSRDQLDNKDKAKEGSEDNLESKDQEVAKDTMVSKDQEENKDDLAGKDQKPESKDKDEPDNSKDVTSKVQAVDIENPQDHVHQLPPGMESEDSQSETTKKLEAAINQNNNNLLSVDPTKLEDSDKQESATTTNSSSSSSTAAATAAKMSLLESTNTSSILKSDSSTNTLINAVVNATVKTGGKDGVVDTATAEENKNKTKSALVDETDKVKETTESGASSANDTITVTDTSKNGADTASSSSAKTASLKDKDGVPLHGPSNKDDNDDKALEIVEDKSMEVVEDDKKDSPLHGPVNKGEKKLWVEEEADENFQPLNNNKDGSKTQKKKVEGWKEAEHEFFEPIHNKKGDGDSGEDQGQQEKEDPAHEKIDLDAQEEEKDGDTAKTPKKDDTISESDEQREVHVIQDKTELTNSKKIAGGEPADSAQVNLVLDKKGSESDTSPADVLIEKKTQ